jgi:hypothetical protein
VGKKNTDALESWESGGYLEMVLVVSNTITRIDVMWPQLTGEESLCRSHPDMEEKPVYRKGYLHHHFLYGLVEFHAALWFEHPYVGQEAEVSGLEPLTLYQSPQLLENCEAVSCVFS